MRILIADTYYPAFLHQHYGGRHALAGQPYAQQWRALMDECFGTADFYSSHLNALGHEATDVVINAEPLQRQWAQENGAALPLETNSLTLTRRRKIIPWLRRISSENWVYAILKAQITQCRPDVLYVQDMHALSANFLREVKPLVDLIVGQIASPYADGADFSPYDLILTSFPHFVARFRGQGLNSEYFRLGFEASLLSRLEKRTRHSLAFVGGLSGEHSERVRFLEAIAAREPLDWWGYGVKVTRPGSPLRPRYQGEAWALEMYNVLHNADIALNFHINAAENFANNMRLFEATGVGALLLTDAKDNLREMFEPDRDVAVYHSPEECVEMIDYYRTHETERKAIAAGGQARTLKEHTYALRMQELAAILSRYLPQAAGRGE